MTAWTTPPYADPAHFTEHDIILTADTTLSAVSPSHASAIPGASAGSTVPGTLSLPRYDGSSPDARRAPVGVVLLTGGGPLDRDETSGPNKPLKDLAWGLASHGVAVLRFDKLTVARPEVMTEPGFTPYDEYVPHAVAAVRALKEHADQVFVVGHSMGSSSPRESRPPSRPWPDS
ncbi:alpha/beta hydrolase family protein [Kribbella sp. NPDC002412]